MYFPLILTIVVGIGLLAVWQVIRHNNQKHSLVTGTVIGYKQFPSDQIHTAIKIGAALRWLLVIEYLNPNTQAVAQSVSYLGVYKPRPVGSAVKIYIDTAKPTAQAWVEHDENFIRNLGIVVLSIGLITFVIFSWLPLFSH